MKRLLFVALGLTLTFSRAQARIGENLAQVKVRYGEGKQIGPRLPGTVQYEFIKDGYKINITFLNDRAILEFFQRQDMVMKEEDIKALLKNYLNGVHFTFSPREKVYKSNDKKYLAGREPGHDDWIFVKDAAAVDTVGGKGKAKGL